jgi:hypothetical protein
MRTEARANKGLFQGHSVFDGEQLTGGFSSVIKRFDPWGLTGKLRPHTSQNAMLEQQRW